MPLGGLVGPGVEDVESVEVADEVLFDDVVVGNVEEAPSVSDLVLLVVVSVGGFIGPGAVGIVITGPDVGCKSVSDGLMTVGNCSRLPEVLCAQTKDALAKASHNDFVCMMMEQSNPFPMPKTSLAWATKF